MPKLIYPKDMSELDGEVFSPDPIRENLRAIQNLVTREGLDWENIEQWSLDKDHVYPGDGSNHTKGALSRYSGEYITSSQISVSTESNTDWFVIQPPGEVSQQVDAGAGVFIWASHLAQTGDWNANFNPGPSTELTATARMRIMTRFVSGSGSGSWGWSELWSGHIAVSDKAGGTPSMVGAVKVPSGGVLSVRLEFRQLYSGNSYPYQWGYTNLSMFVVNQ